MLLAGGIAGYAVAATDLPNDVYPDSPSCVPLIKREMLDPV